MSLHYSNSNLGGACSCAGGARPDWGRGLLLDGWMDPVNTHLSRSINTSTFSFCSFFFPTQEQSDTSELAIFDDGVNSMKLQCVREIRLVEV